MLPMSISNSQANIIAAYMNNDCYLFIVYYLECVTLAHNYLHVETTHTHSSSLYVKWICEFLKYFIMFSKFIGFSFGLCFGCLGRILSS